LVKAVFKRFKDGEKVHHGFVKAYASVRLQLHKEIRKALSVGNIKTILFTGHSLGGALAVVAALDIRLHYADEAYKFNLITLGQPRVGNHAFSAAFKLHLQAQLLTCDFKINF